LSSYNEYKELSKGIDYVVANSSVQLSVSKRNAVDVEDLQRIIDEYKPDVIHSHLFAAEIVSRSCYYPAAKWFSHGHDNMVQFANFSFSTLSGKNLLTNYYEKRYLFNRYRKNGGNNFIAISRHAADYLLQTAPQYPTTLILNAIDYKRFAAKPTQVDRKKKLTLINTGSFVDKKNQAFLVDIACGLDKRGVDFEVHLLGDGKNRIAIEKKIAAAGIQSKVLLHGNVDKVEEYLWQSDIYVHTATYEPLGLVLIEAMAAGLPVVTLDGKGNRDLIEEGKNGYMIDEQNAEWFADTIMKLYNDAERYVSMSEYARSYAAGFDIGQYIDKLIALYNG
jgi:glycosyltransferase involved in cell wall biosynthesis